MNVEELKKQLESGELVGEDLSDTVLDGVDFTSCKLRRVSQRREPVPLPVPQGRHRLV